MNKEKYLYHAVMNLIVAVFAILCLSHTAQAAQNWTGDGGKGTSITILAPQATGLAENQNHLPALIQGEFISNFSTYSAIDVLDWQRREAIYVHILSSPSYNDSVQAQTARELGNLIPTTHFMDGKLIKTPTGYNLQISIIRNSDKMTTASYSGNFTFWELNNLTGIRRASLELLPKMGVALTAEARQELAGAAQANYVTAQTALARGVTAQRQGTEVAALSYYFQAAAFDPSMTEAVNRSSVLNANITSGNIGDNVRNDIQWRREWVERLKETEEFFHNFNKMESMPYTLFYTNDIKQGTINYEKETVTMSIETYLYGSGVWTLSIERALQAVWDGLNATGRKDTWELGSWPRRGVTDLNAFTRKSQTFSVVFELVNNQNNIIGRQTLQSGGSWELNWGGRPVINVYAADRKPLHFQNVNANDITDNLTIRVASVNGKNAEAAAIDGVLQIRVITGAEVAANDRFRFAKGEIQGFANYTAEVTGLVIHNTIWGDPVISIGPDAFRGIGLHRLIISKSVISIGDNAFSNNNIESITIGANVTMGAIGIDGFPGDYNQNGRQADTYTLRFRRWMSEQRRIQREEEEAELSRQRRIQLNQRAEQIYEEQGKMQKNMEQRKIQNEVERHITIGWRFGFGVNITAAGSSSEWFDMTYVECEEKGDAKKWGGAGNFDIGLTLNIGSTDMMTLTAELNIGHLRNKINYDSYSVIIDNSIISVPALIRIGKSEGFYLETGFQCGFPIESWAKIKKKRSRLHRGQDHGVVGGFGVRLYDANDNAYRNIGLRFTHQVTKWDKDDTLNAPFIINFTWAREF